MNSISISQISSVDFDEISNLIKLTIKELFQLEGIIESHPEDLGIEIKNQINLLKKCLESNGKDEYFLKAEVDNRLVGIMAYGSINNIISSNMNLSDSGFVEIKSAYIHPEFQGRGIGKKLFAGIILEIKKQKIQNYCFDCGYKSSQEIWTHLFGPPSVILIDYFGKRNHHYIWIKKGESI